MLLWSQAHPLSAKVVKVPILTNKSSQPRLDPIFSENAPRRIEEGNAKSKNLNDEHVREQDTPSVHAVI